MKPIKTPQSNVTLTLHDPATGDRIADGDLPAQRAMVYDSERGETQEDARLAFISLWLPDEGEARKLEAGAAIEITITSTVHPPIAVGVTDAVVPQRELIHRGRVERALGQLYADMKERVETDLRTFRDADPPLTLEEVSSANLMPSPATFADLWTNALDQTREAHERAERAWRIIDPRRSNGHDTTAG